MDWFKENKFLSGLLAVVIIGTAILGFLLINQRGKFTKAQSEYESVSKKVEQLRKRPLFPSEDNLELQKKEAKSFSEAVDRLHAKLLAYQRPLDTTMSDSAFQDLLNQKIIEAKSRAAREEIEIEGEFAFGLDRYTSELPKLDAVPELSYSLEAADYVIGKLFDSDVKALLSMDREPLAVETRTVASDDEDEEEADSFYEDDEEPEDEESEENVRTQKPTIVVGKSGVLVRHPFKVRFRSGSDAIERFLEFMANTTEDAFLYDVRIITLDNSAKDGPARGGSTSRRRSNQIAADDSKVVLGTETVETTVWIDAIRINPIAEEDSEEAEGDPDA
ncbi:Amuc_1100 family pilus-like protein [Verrucomicrobiales bacterium]|nr:Amuc_1100 family pilus-like protein [Verrucomicrobiales bacterium]